MVADQEAWKWLRQQELLRRRRHGKGRRTGEGPGGAHGRCCRRCVRRGGGRRQEVFRKTLRIVAVRNGDGRGGLYGPTTAPRLGLHHQRQHSSGGLFGIDLVFPKQVSKITKEAKEVCWVRHENMTPSFIITIRGRTLLFSYTLSVNRV